MRIGPYELHAIETGRFGLDGGAMFGVVPKPLWEKTNPPDEKNRISLAARALLLVGNGKKILVDVGNGNKYNDKLAAIYKFENPLGDMVASLGKHSIAPEDITDVILTHLHFDHAGGSTTRVNGEVVPTFPKAKYYVQREHWVAATRPTERDRASFFEDDFMPLRRAGILEFTEDESEILPCIGFRVVNGHTTSLQCPVISDGKTTLLYCADLMPTTSHIQLPWIMAYDLRPLITLEEKRNILNELVERNGILFFEHDPNTEAVRVQRTDKGIVAGERVTIG